MRVIVSEFISLDGVAQAPGGPQEDTSGGFRHDGWSLPFFDPTVMREIAERRRPAAVHRWPLTQGPLRG